MFGKFFNSIFKTEKPTPIKKIAPKTHDNDWAKRKGDMAEHKNNISFASLPPECRYLHDIMLVNPKSKAGYSQIDHVVVTPYVIIVVETKNYSGNIKAFDHNRNWLLNGKEIANPIRQNYGHVMAIKSHLKKYNKVPIQNPVQFERDFSYVFND